MQYKDQTARVVRHIKEVYSAEPEFLWARSPGNAAFRYAGNGKWFAALLLDTQGRVLGLPHIEKVDILNLKCDPRVIGSLLDGRRFLPGYHMNKEHWITLLLDGSIPLEEIFPLIEMSYGLVATLKKKSSTSPRT